MTGLVVGYDEYFTGGQLLCRMRAYLSGQQRCNLQETKQSSFHSLYLIHNRIKICQTT